MCPSISTSSYSTDTSPVCVSLPTKLDCQLRAEMNAAVYCRTQTTNLIKRLRSHQTRMLTANLKRDLLQLWRVTGVYYSVQICSSLIFTKHGICVVGKKSSFGDELRTAADIGYLGPCEDTFRCIIHNLQSDYSISDMKVCKRKDIYPLGSDSLSMGKMLMGTTMVVIGLPLLLIMAIWGGINGQRELQRENKYWIEQARRAASLGDPKVSKIIQDWMGYMHKL